MAYRFKIGEGCEAGVSRVGAEQIERAIAQLEGTNAGTAVHETRKCIKRTRALLRLVREGVGEAVFSRENTRLGDIGRMLSSSRDQTVLRATADRLAGEHPQIAPALRAFKRSVPEPERASNGAAARRLTGRAIRELKEAGRAWREIGVRNGRFDTVARGLARGLFELRAALAAAEDGDDEAVHDWRKAVQRHWRHMLLLREAWPLYFEARAAEAKQVSELLGFAQDLTLLIVHAGKASGKGLSEAQAKTIAELAAERRKALRKAAHERCSRLVAEGPEGHARRASSYWQAAQGIVASDEMAGQAASMRALAAADEGLTESRVRRSGRSRDARAKSSRTAKRSGRKPPGRRKRA